MKNFTKNSLQVLFSIGLAALFLYLAFQGKDIGGIISSLTDVHWSWFVMLFVGSIISHIIRAWRWQYLLTPVKPNVSLRNAFSAVMIGYLVNNGVPRLGEFIRPYALGKLEGVSKSAALGTIVLERILDLVTFALIVLTVLFAYSETFATWFPAMANLEWLFFVGAVAMTAIFAAIIIKAEFFFTMFKWVARFLPKKIREQSERIFESFISGFQAAKNPKNLFMIGLTSILIWFCYIALLYIPFYIYNFPAEYGLDFGSATVLQVASGLAFAMPTPSGIGSYQAFTSFTLTQLYHVNSIHALSYAVYTWTVGFIATTVVGLYYFFKDKIHVAEIMETSVTVKE
ncbi:MAG: lysylphosphatidylglycerol synthase transmembrane domain-containing protein [Bacteroidota bacterium]|nr:lysylphosphatidylglycerol synthase transmembrane domain-containing protein [Bacteroidota bacterium]